MVSDNYKLVISAKETENALAVADLLIPPEGGSATHPHATFQELFYVIEGEVVLRNEIQTYVTREGLFVSISKGGVIHSSKNQTDFIPQILFVASPLCVYLIAYIHIYISPVVIL